MVGACFACVNLPRRSGRSETVYWRGVGIDDLQGLIYMQMNGGDAGRAQCIRSSTRVIAVGCSTWIVRRLRQILEAGACEEEMQILMYTFISLGGTTSG